MIRRPASKRLLTSSYRLKTKASATTPDGQGGRTVDFSLVTGVLVKGTPRNIVTEEFPDILGDGVADRGIYVAWLNPTTVPQNEDRIVDTFDDREFEIKRTTFQDGLARIFMVDLV